MFMDCIKSISLLSILLMWGTFFSCSIVKTETQLQEALGKTNIIIIKKTIDLKGETLFIPEGSTIWFKRGSLVNCDIIFNHNYIKGHPRFQNCTYKGGIIVDKIDDRDFPSIDDTATFSFLLSNAIINGAKCDFYRNYKIEMTGSYLLTFEEMNSGAEISFHECRVFNTTVFKPARKKPVVLLRNVKNITIRDCYFKDADEHNTHNYHESTGCTFIQCYGDCESINVLNCVQENGDCFLRSGVWVHDSSNVLNTPKKGLCNSTLSISSYNSSYGLALYCGDNLNIDINTNNPHRGFYCAGVTNSTINYSGHHPIETKCHILIKDAVYLVKNEGQIDMKGCSNLVINAHIDDILSGECVVDFQSYGTGRKGFSEFGFRRTKCHHKSIDISVDIDNCPTDGFFVVCGFSPDLKAIEENEMVGCIVSDLKIHDVGIGKCFAKRYLCNIGPFIEAYMTVENVGNAEDGETNMRGFDFQVQGSARGKVTVKNSVIGNIFVLNKNTDLFRFEIESSSTLGGINHFNNATSRDLVKVRRF